MNGSCIDTYAISDRDFSRLGRLIQTELGIKMPPSKKFLLQTRLQKRLRSLGMKSFSEYCDYLSSQEGKEKELIHMFDLVTTNKTDFFREPRHFDYLLHTALPELARLGAGIKKNLVVWSAGCSTGEEPYTIAMIIREFAERHPGFNFLIIATDVSTRVLAAAERGIYDEERIAPIPMEFRKKYLLRSRDRTKRLVKIAPELRSLVRFRRLNFMAEDFGFRELMDIIFCRNVFIYFDRETQERLVNRFSRHLAHGGYFFIGHCDTLADTMARIDIPLVQAAPAVYRKPL